MPYTKKDNVQSCSNYRGVEQMRHTMKLGKMVVELRLRNDTMVSLNQSGFMLGRSTMESIYLLRQLIKRY